MKKKIALLLILALVVSTVAVAGCGGSAKKTAKKTEENYVIKVGFTVNEDNIMAKYGGKFKELVEKYSNGRITVKLYPNAQLGSDVQMITQCKAGTLEAVITTTTNVCGFEPKFMIFDAPFLMPNDEVTFKVLDGPTTKKILNSLTEKDIIGLSLADYGYRQLTNSIREVKSLADAKGLKIRTMENPVHLAAFRAMGMNPTPMAFSELFSALQQKALDGQENPVNTIEVQKFYEVQKYLTLTNHVRSILILAFSKKLFDTYSPEDQEILKKAAQEAAVYARELNVKWMDDSLVNIKKLMTVTELTPEAAAEFRNATKDVIYQFQDKIGKDLIEEMLAEIASYSK